ncbi:MAG: FMN-binding protein [Cocleimonas sp.]|nr:FMN-binding protein [Cocleimonas sp.]
MPIKTKVKKLPSVKQQRKQTLLNLLVAFLLVLVTSVLFSYYSVEAKSKNNDESGDYKQASVFLSEAFNKQVPKASAIWMKGETKATIKKILGHDYHKLRVKYWMKNNISVWILDEIGKEKPITTGIVVNRGRIGKVEVLAFRETRGWEVKYPFFTDQFKGVLIKDTKENKLNKNIDGITGATLSVNALSAQARMALYLHRIVTTKK